MSTLTLTLLNTNFTNYGRYSFEAQDFYRERNAFLLNGHRWDYTGICVQDVGRYCRHRNYNRGIESLQKGVAI